NPQIALRHSTISVARWVAWSWPRSIGDVEIHTFEGVAGNLRPDAVLLDRDLVHLDIVDLELAGLLVHPEIDVVILVRAAGFAEVSADEIFPFLLQVAHRLVDLDE